jgi:hypothetical protein
VITYRKEFDLEITRASAPEMPFCCATTIRPYRQRATRPITIDYLDSTAFAHEPRETLVTHDVRDQLERERRLDAPLLIEATGALEEVFRRGSAAARYCEETATEAIVLISSDGAVPEALPLSATLAVAIWPLHDDDIDAIFSALAKSGTRWGVVLPVVLTITTELSVVGDIANRAAQNGASFMTALPIDLDPTAKREIASIAIRSDEEGEDAYSSLFGDELDPLIVATERHVAALAHEHGMLDYIPLPNEKKRDNWYGATLLARVAQRMFRMEREIEQAWAIHRSSRIIAELGKPVAHVAGSASLSIIDGLDAASIEILEEWLQGESSFADRIAAAWRLRRDLYR